MARGLFVAILGPDGAGKSTLAASIESSCQPLFPFSLRQHVRPRLFGRSDAPDLAPHSHRSAGFVRSVLKLAFLVLDYTLGYWVITRPAVKSGALCIADRYFHDLLVDPVRYRCRPPRWLIDRVVGLMPKPDLVFVLVAPRDVIAQRKDELDAEEIERQTKAYAGFAATDNTVCLLDASGTPAEIADQARHALASYRRLAAPAVGPATQPV
jgi:thymidylate kinase